MSHRYKVMLHNATTGRYLATTNYASLSEADDAARAAAANNWVDATVWAVDERGNDSNLAEYSALNR